MKHTAILPGLMKLETAAAYCDMKVADFQRAVATGALPDAVLINGQERWRVVEIERQFEEVKLCERKMWGGRVSQTSSL